MAADAAIMEGQWVTDFFRDADKLDLPVLMSWFADDIDLRIANMPPVLGRAEAKQTFADFWSQLSGMSHQRVELIVRGNDAAQMAIVTYTRKDGKTVSLPVASHIRRNDDGKFTRLWIYIDIGPLFAD